MTETDIAALVERVADSAPSLLGSSMGNWIRAGHWYVAAASDLPTAAHEHVVMIVASCTTTYPSGATSADQEVYLAQTGRDFALGWGTAGTFGKRSNAFRSSFSVEQAIAHAAHLRGSVTYLVDSL